MLYVRCYEIVQNNYCWIKPYVGVVENLLINGFDEVRRNEGIGLMSDVNDIGLCVFTSSFDQGDGDPRESSGFSQAFSPVADMRLRAR